MIEALWQELKAEADQQRLSAGLIRRRIHPESPQDLFLALERPGRYPSAVAADSG